MADCGDVKKVFVPSSINEKEKIKDAPISGIQISDVSAEKIKTFLDNDDLSAETYGLKISVTSDGCSGHAYTMDLAEVQPCIDAGDKIFSHNGATIMVEKTSYMFVLGSILDYKEALTGSGFNLVNPNIKKTCSCGSSFAV